VVPTFNERENLERLLQSVEMATKDTPHRVEVLVVDDSSPDGTGELAETLREQRPWLHVMHRVKRRGRGAAGVDGFKWALDEGADWIVEMDGDLSHDPAHLPDLFLAMEEADVALGSRFVEGGKDLERTFLRRLITRLAGRYVRALLHLDIKDVSSGYRCFRREVLDAIDLEDTVSTGPSIVLELLYKLCLAGFTVKEVPIVFRDRRQGVTKLDYVTLMETLVMVLRLRKMAGTGRIRSGLARG